MARDISGSIREVQINGISYRAAADVNITEVFTQWENSRTPTSGTSMRKMVKRVTSREGVVLVTNSAEREQIKLFAESVENLELNYTNTANDTYSAIGSIEVENNETEDNRTTLQMHPIDDWVLFEG